MMSTRNRKKNQKKRRPRASKKFTRKARIAAGEKITARNKGAKSKPTKNRVSRKKKKVVHATAAVRRKSQSIETVSLEPKGLGTRAGVGAGDLQGLSILENVASEASEDV